MNLFFDRIRQFQKRIGTHDAYLITDENNIRYLANFTGTNGQIFLTAKKTYLLTDFRYLRVAKKVIPANCQLINIAKPIGQILNELIQKHNITSLFFEAGNINYQRYCAFKKNLKINKFEPGKNLIESLRIIKSEEEIKLITKAQRIAEKVFLEVKRNLKTGKTEQQIAWEIETFGHNFGADTISFPAIVGFGSNSGSPHHQNSNRKLKKGEMVLIDMGMKYKGYCSDMTRMIFTAKPNPLQQKIYNLVLEAQEYTINNLKAGIIGKNADKWSRDIIENAGYGKTFGHSLGHGIGLEVHESPNLSTGYNEAIPENTIVTVEPGIYLENSFGVRIEDMVLVKRDKVINLTKIPKDITRSIKLI